MLCIAMTESGGREPVACIVDHHRTKHDLVTTVTVNIGNGKVMESIAKPWRTAIVAVPSPTLSKFVSILVYIKGTELMARVAATSQEDAGITAIQIRRTKVMLGSTVACITGPPHRCIARLSRFKTRQRIVHRGPGVTTVPTEIRLTRRTIEVEQVFCTFLGIFITWGIVVHVTHLDGLARSGVDDHIVGTTHQGLGLAVLIPVVENQVKLLIRSCHQVWSHIY